MLHEFLSLHRAAIIARTREKVATRTAPQPTEAVLEHGVPLFLEQLVDTLRREQETPARPTSDQMAQSALLHGGELRQAGFTLGQVVHGYGDVCQAVTELAIELQSPISADEFKTLNRCLDEAIAQAVTEYARQRDLSVSHSGTERFGFFAHELRNLLHNSILAFEVLKSGTVGVGGSTGAMLERNLIALRDLVERSMAEVRREAGIQRREHVPLAELIEEVALAAAIEGRARGLQFTATPVEPGISVDVDRQLMAAALGNLVQNGFKFSRPGGRIVLRTDTAGTADRALIEVEDECGGLPPGRTDDLFRPFEQRGADRSGLGLGLAIARETVAANAGEIRARSLPGHGCIFTVDLPRVAAPSKAGAALQRGEGPRGAGPARPRRLGPLVGGIVAAALTLAASWGGAADAARPSRGRDVFRFETFGNESFWTDTLRMQEVISTAVDPTTALSVGLKVDADALPPGILKTADLKSAATTIALLKLNAVVGLKGTVVSQGGKDTLTRVGITCALCHSTVDDSVMPGIGHRLDGRPNLTLNPGAIIALSPALDAAKKAVYNSWGAGKYDPRYNQDGKSGPVVIPPAFGLAGVRLATYTGDGDITYWNNYVAVTQMGGHGSFKEPRLGISIDAKGEDLVKPRLPALRLYQHSLAKPAPPAGSFDGAGARRGRAVFAGAGKCATCHAGPAFTDAKLHAAAETGMDASYAQRTATKKYRATPLRALWSHAPYFHDGTAADLAAVVEHYDGALGLKLSAQQKKDLVEYLKSI